jgi:AcrR family transcriptional regulator
MTKGEQTRQHIIQQAATLFNQRGFIGSSVSDVMQYTGLQKGGIYRHFQSKEQLARAHASPVSLQHVVDHLVPYVRRDLAA